MERILTAGLTGGIGCGRTTLSRHLRRPGWLLLDADAIVHALMAPGGRAVEPVAGAFGEAVRDPGGGINRGALGAIVFGDPQARRRLEGILHPMVYEEIDRSGEAFAADRAEGIVVVDAALMVETGSYKRYDRLVVAHCPPAVQLRRVMERDRLDEAGARRRIDAQAPLRQKVALADYAIDTGGSLEETEARTLEVAGLLEQDMRDKAAGRPLQDREGA